MGEDLDDSRLPASPNSSECILEPSRPFFPRKKEGRALGLQTHDSYLVDPASSHMLVSKIKPCMSKYKHLYTVKLQMAHYIRNNLFDGDLLHG